ncbi:hypothetical protein JOM56_015386 [Amanita muscaria]
MGPNKENTCALDPRSDSTFWSWLDWSAAYMISKGKKDSSKDLSSWVFRTIMENNAASPVWDNMMTSKVVDAIVFFIWRNIDAFIAVESYLSQHPPPVRPEFKAVTKTRLEEKYPSIFEDTKETVIAMRGTRGKRAKLTTTGLWTLDFSSCYGWRHDKNTHIIYSSHIFTARLEQHFVDSYRLKFLKDCPAAAHLRKTLANELSQFCLIAPVRFKDHVTGLTGVQNARKFFFPDGIKVPAPAAELINTIDVQSLLDKLAVQKRSQAWLAESTSALARFEKLECLASVPGGDQLDPTIRNHITQLIQAIEINVAHLGKIDNALQEDPNTVISPFQSRFEPSLEEIPSIEYARRPAFTPSDVRKPFGNDPSPSETNDLDNNHDDNMEDELVQTVNPPPTAPSSQTTDLPMDIDVSVTVPVHAVAVSDDPPPPQASQEDQSSPPPAPSQELESSPPPGPSQIVASVEAMDISERFTFQTENASRPNPPKRFRSPPTSPRPDRQTGPRVQMRSNAKASKRQSPVHSDTNSDDLEDGGVPVPP